MLFACNIRHEGGSALIALSIFPSFFMASWLGFSCTSPEKFLLCQQQQPPVPTSVSLSGRAGTAYPLLSPALQQGGLSTVCMCAALAFYVRAAACMTEGLFPLSLGSPLASSYNPPSCPLARRHHAPSTRHPTRPCSAIIKDCCHK